MATRLFFGFEYRHPHLAVVAVDGQGTLLLRARFPLLDPSDSELTDGAAPAITAALAAFVRAHDADAVCGTDEHPAVLAALARRIGNTVRYVSGHELDHADVPGANPLARFELGVDAHHRALLAGLALAAGTGAC
jgi:hypothetical protein